MTNEDVASSLARGRWFNLALSLSVTNPVITPVMSIVDLVFFGKFVLIC